MDKKVIRINFCGTGNEFKKNNNLILNILQRHFSVEICDNPDFIICGNGGIPFEYMKYDCIRIMLMTENFSPDFTLFDYCIGFDHLEFGDRYFRLPLAYQSKAGLPWIPEEITQEQAKDILKKKNHFCNFIYRHESSHGIREELFRRLSEYKYVVSPGNYLNNLSGEITSYSDEGGRMYCDLNQKYQYVRDSKFTIACDSVVYPGFVTEKIVDAFKGHSIPIYFGSPTITDDFNSNAFIHCESVDDVDQVVQTVIDIDQDDEKYLQMLMQCPLKRKDGIVDLYSEFESFLIHIFSQPLSLAARRPRYYYVDAHNLRLKEFAYAQAKRNSPRRKKIRKLIRKIKNKVNRH